MKLFGIKVDKMDLNFIKKKSRFKIIKFRKRVRFVKFYVPPSSVSQFVCHTLHMISFNAISFRSSYRLNMISILFLFISQMTTNNGRAAGAATMVPPDPPAFFSIVQTEESGSDKPILSIVPSGWVVRCDENNTGTLMWPPKTWAKPDVRRAMRTAASVPQNDWISFECKLKRPKVKSTKEGARMVREMIAFSDTSTDTTGDDEGLTNISNKFRRAACTKNAVKNADDQRHNFNAMMVDI